MRAPALRRLRDVALTVLGLAVLVPLLVVASAVAGLDPKHWSGVSLSALDLRFVDLSPYHGGSRPPVMDDVTDALQTMEPDTGWVKVLGDGDGRVYVGSTRMSSQLFVELGRRFGGETVGVIYAPLDSRPSLDGPGGAAMESIWQRTDPLGTWATLVTGFPAVLGPVLVLTAVAWMLLRRRRRRRAFMRSPADSI